MPEALIHVGIHKTGTTSIQRAFFEGRQALAESGILYPLLAGKANHFDFYTCFCDAPLAYRMVKARGIDNLQQLQDLQNNIRREFEAQLDAAPKQRVILSSEALSLMNAGEMGRFVSYLSERGLKPLKFIVYLRDYASYWESIVQQDIKGGAYLDFADEEVNLRRLRMYRPLLEALRANAPRENISVRIFHRPLLKDGDVVADFFAQADVSGIPVLDRILNPSLSRVAMVTLNELNKRLSRNSTARLRDLVKVLRRLDGPKYYASAEVLRRIVERTREERDSIAREWFDGHDPFAPILESAIVNSAETATAADGARDLADAIDGLAMLYAHVERDAAEQTAKRLLITARFAKVRRKHERAEEAMREYEAIMKRLQGAAPLEPDDEV